MFSVPAVTREPGAYPQQADIPTVLADRIVRDVATEKLKHLRGGSKPS
jgi:hypothetical protein